MKLTADSLQYKEELQRKSSMSDTSSQPVEAASLVRKVATPADDRITKVFGSAKKIASDSKPKPRVPLSKVTQHLYKVCSSFNWTFREVAGVSFSTIVLVCLIVYYVC
jgi:hypothetical protein